MSYLVVPFVIVAITVLNVMVASVYARIREIGIYGVVGLNPTHVTGLFLAEAMLYAVVSSIGGYMTSMVVLGLLDTFRLIPPEANLNYASTFIFVALGLIMATAIGSTLYPAIAAGRIVTPSLLRKWKMSSSPVGDDWTMPLPFSGTVEDAGAQLLYLKEFADTSTAIYGRFAASDATYIDEGRVKHLKFVARLAPFDAGITQEVTITSFRPDPSKAVVNFRLNIHRLTGHMVSWQNLNRYFVDQIRKQFLIYRSLPTSDKQGYIDQAKNV